MTVARCFARVDFGNIDFFFSSLLRIFSSLLCKHGQLTFQRERENRNRGRVIFIRQRAATRSEREANERDFAREKYVCIRW